MIIETAQSRRVRVRAVIGAFIVAALTYSGSLAQDQTRSSTHADPDPVVATLVSQPGNEPIRKDAASDVAEIKAQSQRLSDAYVRGDVDALVAIYTPDGVAAPAGRDFVRGRDALLSLWALPEGRTVRRHASTPVEIEVDGDHAYDWGYYEGQAEQDGEPLPPFRGTYVIVWERDDHGTWRIAMDMWSALHERQMD